MLREKKFPSAGVWFSFYGEECKNYRNIKLIVNQLKLLAETDIQQELKILKLSASSFLNILALKTKVVMLITSLFANKTCPKTIILDPISEAHIPIIIDNLKNYQCAEDLELILHFKAINKTGLKRFITMLNSNQCPKKLKLTLHYSIADVIENEFLPALSGKEYQLTLHPRYTHLIPEELDKLCEIIKYGELPPNTRITFDKTSRIGDEEIKKIALALQSVHAQAGLFFDLSSNGITDVGAKLFADALKHPHFPARLSINLRYNRLTTDSALYFAEIFKRHQTPPQLRLSFNNDTNGAKDRNEILVNFANALKTNTNVIELKAIYEWDDTYDCYYHRLDFYCERNKLLAQYPEFETYIKKICYENNLYSANAPLSLKCYSAFKYINLFKLEKTPHDLPIEIREFIENLSRVKTELEKQLSNPKLYKTKI